MPTKVHIVKAMVFPVVMYGCENWTIKKAEHWRIDAFKLWCWGRFLRFHWTARRSNLNLKGNQLWIFIGRTDAELKLQYFGHLMGRGDPLVKTLMLRNIEGRRRRGWPRMKRLNRITELMDMSLSKLWEIAGNRNAWHAAVHGVTRVQQDWATKQQQQHSHQSLVCCWLVFFFFVSF